jgi:hypothetical protein
MSPLVELTILELVLSLILTFIVGVYLGGIPIDTHKSE